MEASYDTASEQLIVTEHKLEEKEKLLATNDQEISSLCRRVTLLEGESWTAENRLGKMTIELANTCKAIRSGRCSWDEAMCVLQVAKRTPFRGAPGSWRTSA